MGYYVELVEMDCDIEEEQYKEALDCFTKLMAPNLFWDWGGTNSKEIRYSWVNTSRCTEILLSETLTEEEKIIDLFQEWGYGFSRHLLREGGGLVSRPPPSLDTPPYCGKPFLSLEAKEFEKWGDDEILWEALAPAIKDQSKIRFKGEEYYAFWQYRFSEGKVVKSRGVVDWGD